MAKVMKDWQFFFFGKEKHQKAEEIRKDVAEFFATEDEKSIDIKGYGVQLTGRIYGDERFPEGEKIITSEVNFIRREEPEATSLPVRDKNDTTIMPCVRSTFSVHTETGSVYYLYDTDISSVEKSIFAIARATPKINPI